MGARHSATSAARVSTAMILLAIYICCTHSLVCSREVRRTGKWAATPGEIAMPHVPNWIGFVGLLLSLILCGSLLAAQLWLFILMIVLGLALVVVENRYERGLIGTRGG